MTSGPDEPFGIYLHWPFCAAKCPYCDFNSHVRAGIDETAFGAALIAELEFFRALSPSRTVSSVFFGGGTPSLMAPQTVERVLDAIAAKWRLARDIEITLEANPTSVEADRFRGFHGAGINRVSIGVQSLVERDLARLGRTHNVAEALDAIATAATRFGRISFDLIYGRMGQSVAMWHDELSRALAFAPDHLSAYQLTIEPATPFFALHEAGKLRLPGERVGRALLEVTHDLCAAGGLPAYEVSNFARPGAECRHNLTYWRYHDYIGVGPGAHGRLSVDGGKYAFVTVRDPERWQAQVVSNGNGIAEQHQLDREQQADELLLMGLRLAEGIDLDRLDALGAALDAVEARTLSGAGLIAFDRTLGRVRVAPKGWPVLDAIIARLAGGAGAGRPDEAETAVPASP